MNHNQIWLLVFFLSFFSVNASTSDVENNIKNTEGINFEDFDLDLNDLDNYEQPPLTFKQKIEIAAALIKLEAKRSGDSVYTVAKKIQNKALSATQKMHTTVQQNQKIIDIYLNDSNQKYITIFASTTTLVLLAILIIDYYHTNKKQYNHE